MALSNLFIIPDFKNGFASVELDGQTRVLKMKDLRKHWSYATKSRIESAAIEEHGDEVLGYLLTDSGQGGIVFVWDPAKNEIIHVTEGAFTVAVTMDGHYVYSLCYVISWGTPAHFILLRSEKGTINALEEGTELNCVFPPFLDNYDGNAGSIKMNVKNDNTVEIEMNGEKGEIQFSLKTKQ